jgi:thiamine biosynthesis lipoprotein
MGTTWSVRLVAAAQHSLDTLQQGIQQQLDSVVAQMSTWQSDSNLSLFNQSAADTWHALPDDFFYVLQYALEVARESNGAYDPTAGPLVNIWGFGPEPKQQRRPPQSLIDTARARVGWQRVELDISSKRALQPGCVYLDLSAIAKGFGVDQVSRYLSQQGIDNHLVEVGGELRGQGIKPDALPWWISLEQPPSFVDEPKALTQTIIALHGLSVATSGDYRRYFKGHSNGKETHYSHTIDPRSGEPIQHGLAAVTVIHRDCITADALSTMLNVMGVTQGMAFATQRSIPALFIERSGAGFVEHLSPELLALLQ